MIYQMNRLDVNNQEVLFRAVQPDEIIQRKDFLIVHIELVQLIHHNLLGFF